MTPEETIVRCHKDFLEKWVNRDPLILQELLDLIHPDFCGFGRGLNEIIENREEWIQMMNKERQGVSEPSSVELSWVKGKVLDNTGFTWGDVHIKDPLDRQFLEAKNLRVSLTWVKDEEWKVVHMHASDSPIMQKEGQSYPIEELKARNRQLEKMVAEKTADLVEKNRALKVEMALERVRVHTMAMHKSEELSQVVTAMFKEFQQLGLINDVARTAINFIDEENGDIVTWLTGLGGEEISNKFEYSAFGNESYEAEYRTYQQVAKDKRKEHKYITTFEGKAFKELIAFALEKRLMPLEDYKIFEKKGIQQWIEHSVYFAYGSLCVQRATPLSDDAFNVLQRFAAVFEQMYTRFLDLQKAEEQAQEIERVFNENERLLHSILPVEVVKELLETGSVKPARFEEVSILFSDFKEFTNIVATIPTKKLISELNELFSEFDDIMETEGIEKIQTVGDAYLAASGLPEEVPDHAIRCVRAGKRMIDFLDRRNETSAIKWKIRIGIHSGPIAAGIVGKRKFAYDIFGDTINTASRIETAGEEGKINVSAYTYDLIKDKFPCEYRGKISAKGKGDLDMYFVK